jgi:septum formation protein
MKRIILASASPRRKQLMEQIGLRFEVEPSSYHEAHLVGGEPHQLVRSLSAAKAVEIARKHTDAIVVAADTVVEIRGQILGKPETDAEAIDMLNTLNGRAHRVITGFTVIDSGSSKTATRSVETRVHLRRLTREEMDAYVGSGEPLGKAGGYAIQGLGAVIVESIEGDYYNVVGLPLSSLAEALQEFGIRVF